MRSGLAGDVPAWSRGDASATLASNGCAPTRPGAALESVNRAAENGPRFPTHRRVARARAFLFRYECGIRLESERAPATRAWSAASRPSLRSRALVAGRRMNIAAQPASIARRIALLVEEEATAQRCRRGWPTGDAGIPRRWRRASRLLGEALMPTNRNWRRWKAGRAWRRLEGVERDHRRARKPVMKARDRRRQEGHLIGGCGRGELPS